MVAFLFAMSAWFGVPHAPLARFLRRAGAGATTPPCTPRPAARAAIGYGRYFSSSMIFLPRSRLAHIGGPPASWVPSGRGWYYTTCWLAPDRFLQLSFGGSR